MKIKRDTVSPANLLLTATLVYWLLLFVATHLPWSLASVATPIWMWDKASHFIAFAGLAILLASAAAMRRRLTLANYVFLFVVGAGYAAVDELVQIPVPGRTGDLFDWFADCVGMAVGLLVHRLTIVVLESVQTRTASL